jgi:hypothetical protein
MKKKIEILKEKTDLAQKIVLLYRTIFDFEKRKNKFSVAINPQKRDGKTNKTVSENERSG